MMETLGPWLPTIFGGILGFSILVYVILDGYDLGTGILFPFATDEEKDMMVASIGPFWDANETWLVLAVGILLVAFPMAHGVILSTLYIPVTLMLIGLILRGVSFEFRAKAAVGQKRWWNLAFFTGSLTTALTQGWMLGLYIMGLETTVFTLAFSIITALCLVIGYCFIGATWLIYKTKDALQQKAIQWAQYTLWGALVGLILVSVFTPFVSERIWDKWFTYPQVLYLSPLPFLSFLLLIWIHKTLASLPRENDSHAWLPFCQAAGLFLTAFIGMAYSFYPYIVPEKLTLYETASAPESLIIILFGAIFVVPVIAGYSVLSYWIFKGKATALRYD